MSPQEARTGRGCARWGVHGMADIPCSGQGERSPEERVRSWIAAAIPCYAGSWPSCAPWRPSRVVRWPATTPRMNRGGRASSARMIKPARSSPRSRGRSEHGVFSYEECCISAHMPGWGHQLRADFCKKCQRWVVTRDSAWCCEHDGCNNAVFKRTLLSVIHSQARNNHLFERKNRMVQPDSLNVGSSTLPRRNAWPPCTW